MTKAVASITYTDVPGFPAGSAIDHIEVTIQTATGGPIAQSVPPGTQSVTFDDVADGTYAITVEAVSADNTVFGTPAAGTFTISSGPATVTLSLPTSVSATQA